jgi:hypothetical protein
MDGQAMSEQSIADMLGTQAEHRFELRRAAERRRVSAGRKRRTGIDRETCTSSASPSPSTFHGPQGAYSQMRESVERDRPIAFDDERRPVWQRVLGFVLALVIGSAMWLGVLVFASWLADRIYQ